MWIQIYCTVLNCLPYCLVVYASATVLTLCFSLIKIFSIVASYGRLFFLLVFLKNLINSLNDYRLLIKTAWIVCVPSSFLHRWLLYTHILFSLLLSSFLRRIYIECVFFCLIIHTRRRRSVKRVIKKCWNKRIKAYFFGNIYQSPFDSYWNSKKV